MNEQGKKSGIIRRMKRVGRNQSRSTQCYRRWLRLNNCESIIYHKNSMQFAPSCLHLCSVKFIELILSLCLCRLHFNSSSPLYRWNYFLFSVLYVVSVCVGMQKYMNRYKRHQITVPSCIWLMYLLSVAVCMRVCVGSNDRVSSVVWGRKRESTKEEKS